MKNTKIIFLTVAVVAVALLSVLGMSNIVETAWQQENTVDNTLDAEITDSVESVFDYPYLQYSKNKETLTDYNKWFGESWAKWRTEEFIESDENMISYQEAANVAGEAIKYIYGMTEQSQNVAALQLYNYTPSRNYIQEKRYIYRFFDSSHNLYTVRIDPYNKIIFQISKDNLKGFRLGDTYEVTDEENKEIRDVFEQYLSFLGIDCEVLSFSLIASYADNGIIHYTINSYLSNDHIASVSINKDKDKYYELDTFSLLYSPDK